MATAQETTWPSWPKEAELSFSPLQVIVDIFQTLPLQGTMICFSPTQCDSFNGLQLQVPFLHPFPPVKEVLSTYQAGLQGEFTTSRAPDHHSNTHKCIQTACETWSREWLYSQWHHERRDLPEQKPKENIRCLWYLHHCQDDSNDLLAAIQFKPGPSSQTSCGRVYGVPRTRPLWDISLCFFIILYEFSALLSVPINAEAGPDSGLF